MASSAHNLALLPAKDGPRLTALADPGKPGAGQVRVRMLYAPINPADRLALQGNYAFALDDAAPLGAEGVGIVDDVGDGVTGIERGTYVLPLTRGNWAQVRSVDAADLIVVPDTITAQTAATLRINPATAALLIEASGCRPGDIILQNAAGSSVAQWVRYFARAQDMRVIDIVRRPHHSAPDAIIDRPNLAEDVIAQSGGVRPVAALDCVAGEASARLAQSLAPGGTVVVFGHLSGQPISLRSQMLTGGQYCLKGFSLRPAEERLGRAKLRSLFDRIFAAVQAGGAPEAAIKQIIPLSRFDDALALAEADGEGRVLLDLTL